jgi:hypothetical protein
LQCIDFNDVAPRLIEPEGDILLRNDLFVVEKWNLEFPREIVPLGQFAIICCLTGTVRCFDVDVRPGEFALIPALLKNRQLHRRAADTSLLRVTVPSSYR